MNIRKNFNICKKFLKVASIGFAWVSCSFAMADWSEENRQALGLTLTPKTLPPLGEKIPGDTESSNETQGPQGILKNYLKNKLYEKALRYCADQCLPMEQLREKDEETRQTHNTFWNMLEILEGFVGKDFDFENPPQGDKKMCDDLKAYLGKVPCFFGKSGVPQRESFGEGPQDSFRIDLLDDDAMAMQAFAQEAFALGLRIEEERQARSYVSSAFSHIGSLNKENTNISALYGYVFENLGCVVENGKILHMREEEAMDLDRMKEDILEVFQKNLPNVGVKVTNLGGGVYYSKENFLRDFSSFFEDVSRADSLVQNLVFQTCSLALRIRKEQANVKPTDGLKDIMQAMIRSYFVQAEPFENINWMCVAYIRMLHQKFNAEV